MGIAVPSQLRKATQQWNPSPPLPLLPPPPLPPRLAMASASTTPTPLPASSSRSEAPPSQTPQPLSRLPPLTTWQPRLSTADMADMADMADTDTGYGGYGKRSAEAWVPDNLAQVPIGGGLCTAVGALAATSGAVVPCFTPEFQAVALAHQQKGKREAEAEPWYGWRGYSGAPIAGGALVIGQNSVTPDYTPEQKGAAWGLNWGLVKREADSEADAYYGYGGYGLGYGGYGYGGLGYGYGKRSADSEADAYYGYSGLGLGYGLGYGGYGYGGLGYGYGYSYGK